MLRLQTVLTVSHFKGQHSPLSRIIVISGSSSGMNQRLRDYSSLKQPNWACDAWCIEGVLLDFLVVDKSEHGLRDSFDTTLRREIVVRRIACVNPYIRQEMPGSVS